MSQLTIYPNKKIILDNSFNLNKLTIIPNQNQVSFCIKLFNLKGFQMTNYFDPFNQIKFVNFNKYRKIFYIISQSNFDFFISNNTISINDQCGYLNLTSSKYEWTHFLFNNFAITKFDYSIKYSKHICPLIFRNSFIYHLNLNEISSSFINRNEFEFVNLSVENLNSSIFSLGLNTYHIELTNGMFNRHVYKRLFQMELNGLIDSIEQDLFKIFSNEFKFLFIRMQYIKNIFMKNNKWLQYLNYNQKISSIYKINIREVLFLVLYQNLPNLVVYTYPDEDFCYFKDFPHEKLVFPVLKPSQTKCTCTLLYLIQYSHLAKNNFDFNFNLLKKEYDLLEFYSEFILKQEEDTFKDCLDNIEERIKECNFEQRFEQCSIESIDLAINNSDFYFTFEDWKVASNKSHLYLFILNQMVSILCLIFNLITLFVIRDKNIKKEMKHISILSIGCIE